MGKVKLSLLIGTGSGVGGASRLILSLLWPSGALAYLWATFAVNLLGCFLIGILGARWSGHPGPPFPSRQAFWITGFCGGFTTVSLFSRQSLALVENGQTGIFALYLLGHLLLCPLMVLLGERTQSNRRMGKREI